MFQNPGLRAEEEEFQSIGDKSITELFRDFYLSQRGVEPTEEVMNIFAELAYEEKTLMRKRMKGWWRKNEANKTYYKGTK